MKKSKFKVGDKLSWFSDKQDKVISGKVSRIQSFGSEIAYTLACGEEGTWEVPEYRLSKSKNPKRKASKETSIINSLRNK